MKGMSFREFYDAVFYGTDMDLKCGNEYYHISSGRNAKGQYGVLVYKQNASPDAVPTEYDKVYDEECEDRVVLMENLMQAPIFGQRSLWEEKERVEVLYF